MACGIFHAVAGGGMDRSTVGAVIGREEPAAQCLIHHGDPFAAEDRSHGEVGYRLDRALTLSAIPLSFLHPVAGSRRHMLAP
jgi:hypothetical protein